MTERDRGPTPDEAREIDYVLQKIRFSFITLAVICWVVALLVYFVARRELVLAIVIATLIPANLVLVWTFGFRAIRGSLSPFVDRRTGKLRIPGGRKQLPVSEWLRMFLWDKRETQVTTVGFSLSGAILIAYLFLH